MKPDPLGVSPAQRLWALTWANVALHGAGLVVALAGMRPGSVVVPLESRMAYLAGAPRAWAWGWGVWMLCSLLLVAWLAVLRDLLPERSAAARLALLLAAAGMAVDLLCDVLQIAVLPHVAASAAAGATELFVALERLAFTGGATVANGLYTAAVLLTTLALAGTVGAAARWAGFATVAAGSAMAVAGLLPSPALLEASTGPTIGFYSVWTVLVARGLRSPRSPAPRPLPAPATAR